MNYTQKMYIFINKKKNNEFNGLKSGLLLVNRL